MEAHQMSTQSVQKLGQLLHEEQEPFILQVYLHSKGCLKKTFNPQIRLSSAGHAHAGNFFKISTTKMGVSKILRAVFNKLNFINVRLKKKHSGFCLTENDQVDTFSLVCQNKQFSPVLVLEEAQSPELPASLRELLAKSPTNQATNDVEDVVGFNLQTSKREMQQRRQLLFDCIKEVLEVHKTQETNKHHCLKELFGAEELRKFICAKIKCWGGQCGNESSITQLLQFDYTGSAQEWGEYGSHTREIAVKISDDIFEDLINELVRSMF